MTALINVCLTQTLCRSKRFLWYRKGKIIKAKISQSERLKETLYWHIQIYKANNRLEYYFDNHSYYDEILFWDITDIIQAEILYYFSRYEKTRKIPLSKPSVAIVSNSRGAHW